MSQIPVLVLAFNRPESINRVFEALGKLKPETVLFAVDGPRQGNELDVEKVKAVQEAQNNISWNTNLETRFRNQNLGLRKAVPDAVSWAIERYGKVIVLEDDAVPGPDFLNYMNFAINNFKNESSIGHVSGYNQVPKSNISDPSKLFRASRYPESYAWGTWERAWKFYSDDLTSPPQFDFNNVLSKCVWNENFKLAKKDLISTWAFRWINSLWNENLICISPNVNIVDYVGHIGGTHTRRKPRADELPLESIEGLEISKNLSIDSKADAWISGQIFHETLSGTLEIKLAHLALAALKVLGK